MNELIRRVDGLLHLWSGAVVLGIDWALFSGVLLSAGAALPLSIPVGAGTAFAVYSIQRRKTRDGRLAALVKALVCGALVAVPAPIFGTLIGAFVASVSGLSSMLDRGDKRPDDPPS